MRLRILKSLRALGLASLLWSAAQVTASADSVVMDWDAVCLQAVRDTKPGPPIVARDLAVLHTCIYDAWAAYDARAMGTQLGGNLRQPGDKRTLANKNEAVSYAAYRALVTLFPQSTEVALFQDHLTNVLHYSLSNAANLDRTTPSGIGNTAAQAVLDYRKNDGSNADGSLTPSGTPYKDYTGYTPTNTPTTIVNPNLWQPLSVSNGAGGFVTQTYITPFWGLVKPFALKSGSQFRPAEGPALYDVTRPATDRVNRRYVQQAQQSLSYAATLTDEQKVIAEYWADGPKSELPPGHWCLFAQYVSHRDGYGVDDDTKMLFALTNAIFDASIVAWDCKRYYNSERPITAIQYLFKGQTIQSWNGAIRGEDWIPYQAATVVTPAFPEFISGHSIFSATGAEILNRYTGSDYFGNAVTVPAGQSRIEPGVVPAADITLYWATFSDAADQAGMSRRYGGIHFVDGDLTGRKLGRKVGTLAWHKAMEYIYGGMDTGDGNGEGNGG